LPRKDWFKTTLQHFDAAKNPERSEVLAGKEKPSSAAQRTLGGEHPILYQRL